MRKIAFYLMNSKGYFVLERFVATFGCEAIDYIVSEEDKKLKKDFYSDIKKLAGERGISFYKRTAFDINVEEQFTGFKIAIGWRWLIENQSNVMVFHDSLLPKYRGFSPLVNSLINGETRGGVTVLFADKAYDKGQIIAQKAVEFSYPLKIEEAIRLVEPIYSELLDALYSKLLNQEPLGSINQDESKATYSAWLDVDDYFIDWRWSAEKIKRFVDAVGFPYDGAKVYLGNRIVKLLEVEVGEDVYVEHRSRHVGKVVFMNNTTPIIICSEGVLKLINISNQEGEALNINFRSRFK